MGQVTLYHGDCLDVMATLPEHGVDTIITDPPYGLSFMGKAWDHGVPGVPFWAEALRVAKPGALLLAFGGTRTWHRLACAIEDAGWELRDAVMWVYGSGFPKSHDISKAIDREAGAEREVVGINEDYLRRKPNGMKTQGATAYGYSQTQQETNASITAPATPAAALWDGWGTALKPAWEPIIVAMAPLDGTFAHNALTWGVAGLNVDGGRVEGSWSYPNGSGTGGFSTGKFMGTAGKGDKTNPYLGTPVSSHPAGRWPANVIHDGSDEVLAGFPNVKAGVAVRHNVGHSKSGNINYATGSQDTEMRTDVGYGDTGSAARFFYCAKASRAERNAGCEGMEERVAGAMVGNQTPVASRPAGDGITPIQQVRAANHHPTVKPLALMRYLCKLTATPTGGVVLDPFMGSGSTGVACVQTGRSFIGIEIDRGYFEIAERRIAEAQAQMRMEL